MTYIGDLIYPLQNTIKYNEYLIPDMDAIECRYSWYINNKLYYSNIIYTIEYYRKYMK